MLNRIDPAAVHDLINWTASYRRDSTIYFPFYADYAVYVPLLTPDVSQAGFNYAEGKTRKVAWFVSNSRDNNGRRNYVHELSK
jgi:glycoprotein 3-alpha-L-fucosyltransferase